MAAVAPDALATNKPSHNGTGHHGQKEDHSTATHAATGPDRPALLHRCGAFVYGEQNRKTNRKCVAAADTFG